MCVELLLNVLNFSVWVIKALRPIIIKGHVILAFVVGNLVPRDGDAVLELWRRTLLGKISLLLAPLARVAQHGVRIYFCGELVSQRFLFFFDVELGVFDLDCFGWNL